MVQVKVKLKLTRISYEIKVSYNTFEKATFDQYLMASLALRSDNDDLASYQYIDEITGLGSLNAHFKKLYEKTNTLIKDQLKDIMDNSKYPMLKIDKSNSYMFYPQLNISVFRNKTYEGNFGEYDDLIQRLHIQEKVISSELLEKNAEVNPEPYDVQLDDNTIKIRVADKWISIDSVIIQELIVNELKNIGNFKGAVHNGVKGNNWYTLTDSVLNDMYANNNYYFYDEEKNHCLIRNENVRKTTISQVAGFYIYKQENVPFENNRDLCEKVISILKSNKAINEFKTKSLITLITYSEDQTAQDVINYVLDRKDSKELALKGIELLKEGIEKKWKDEALKSFMKYADSSSYSLIYKANPQLISEIDKLIMINQDFLIPAHKKKVEEYKNDIQAKIDTIKKIIGEVTASGIRERLKDLKNSDQTKRFSKLANKYIGHSTINYEELSLNELDKCIGDLTEMQDLMQKLKIELDKINN